jgi:chromosome segregation ATPase
VTTPSLRRGLFGYSRKSVREVVADREFTAIRADKDARAAEEEIARLRSELESARREASELEARNRDLASQLKDSAERFRAVERSSSPSTTEGLTDVLHAAERALARLTDAARRSAEEELGETERARDALRTEIEQLAEWRGGVAPLAEAVRRAIDEASAATAALASRLSELAEVAAPPDGEREPRRGPVITLEEADLEEAREGEGSVVAPAPGPWATGRETRAGAG